MLVNLKRQNHFVCNQIGLLIVLMIVNVFQERNWSFKYVQELSCKYNQ